jgi:hypothetical protein
MGTSTVLNINNNNNNSTSTWNYYRGTISDYATNFVSSGTKSPQSHSDSDGGTDDDGTGTMLPPPIHPKPNHYYMVSFTTTGAVDSKNSKRVEYRYYVGELLKAGTHPARDEYNFKFLRYSRKVPYQFVWPNAQDEACVSLVDVKVELSVPKRGRRGELLFLSQEISPYMKWIQ